MNIETLRELSEINNNLLDNISKLNKIATTKGNEESKAEIESAITNLSQAVGKIQIIVTKE